MEIHVYDRDLRRIGQTENQTSLIWTRKYHEPGTFEIHLPITAENLSLFRQGNIVSFKGAKEAGVIEDLEQAESISEMKNNMIVVGRFLSSYMDRRLIKNTLHFNGTAEAAMFAMYDACVEIPAVEKADLKGFTEKISFQATMKNLLTYETKISKASNIGFRFRPVFAQHKIIFETYAGVDHSMNQRKNNRVIFTESYNNLDNPVYKYNDQSLKTLAVVGGEGEGTSRKYVTVGSGEGLDLREIFVDARDCQQGDLSDSEYVAELIQRGKDALNENKIAESMEADIKPDINFTYETDYDLGDIVTVKKAKWNIYMNQRITEISEVYEDGGKYIVPTLGTMLPETLDWRDD